jgi:hypothetical protein
LPVDLRSNEFIECSAEFPALTDGFNVSLKATTLTHDPEATNDTVSLQLTPSSDLQTSLALGQGSSSHTRLEGSCTNFGPSPATHVTCAYGGLPQDATVTCMPPGEQGILQAGASILCNAEFPKQSRALSARIVAASASADPTPGNDEVAVDVPPQLGEEVMQDGFESD